MAQLELEVHINEPVDENGAHTISDVSLRRHVVRAGLIFDLELAQVLVNVLDVLDDVVGLITVGGVDVENGNCRSDLTTKKAFKATDERIAFSHARTESGTGTGSQRRSVRHGGGNSSAIGKVSAKLTGYALGPVANISR